jgi:PAS domain S-box-containing protein
MDGIPAAVLLLGPRGELEDANRVARDVFFHDAGNRITGRMDRRIAGLVPEMAAEVAAFEAGTDAEAVFEKSFATSSGPRWFQGRLRRVDDGSGRLVTLAVLNDLTERREVEEALRRSGEELDRRVRERTTELARANESIRALFRALPDMFCRMDRNGIITEYVAPEGWRFYVPPEMFLGQRIADVLPSEAADPIMRGVAEALRERRVVSVEYALPFPQGLRHEEARIVATGDDDVVVVVRNVSDRVAAGRVLEESESRYRNLVEMSPDAIVVHQDGVIVFANAAAGRVFDPESPQAIVGRPVMDFVHPDSAAAVRERVALMAKTGAAVPVIEETFLRADGSAMPVEVAAAPTTFGGRRAFQVVVRDVTERNRAETTMRRQAEELAAAERRYRSIVENAVEGIYQCNPADGRMVAANPALARMLGFGSVDELLADAASRAHRVHDADARRAEFYQALEQVGSVQGWEYQAIRKDGRPIWVMESARAVRGDQGEIVFVEGLVQDVTDRKELEEQLRQAQKMEAVGRLAGGIAHDFNNLLTAVVGYGAMLQSRMRDDSIGRRDVDEIVAAGQRAAKLTAQLLAFSRRQVLQPARLDLNEVVLGVQEMLRRLIGEDISLVTRLNPAIDSVFADRGQVEQVIVNLAVNARDAMEHGGVLRIETLNLSLTRPDPVAHPGVPTGRWVRLTVTDTGCGMDDEVRSHVFEPFFTTKGPGKGTGLGLAVVYGIVRQSGGFINAWSRPREGATFHIYLPRVEGSADSVSARARMMVPKGGTETILVVEDDDAVRELAAGILARWGYHVMTGRDDADALALVEREPGPVHLLFTDVVMPGMNGRELATRLCARLPELRVVYTSGYTDSDALANGLIEGRAAFLQKPFTPEGLVDVVRRVLDEPRIPCDEP